METTFNITAGFIVSEIELVYRSKTKLSELPTVNNSKLVYQTFLRSWNPDKIEFVEQMKVMLLNRSCGILGIIELSTGGTSQAVCDLKLLFAAAIKANADSFIMAHNHPSGSLTPSAADINITNRVMEAGKLLDIRLTDHIIVTTEGYYSFRDEGLL